MIPSDTQSTAFGSRLFDQVDTNYLSVDRLSDALPIFWEESLGRIGTSRIGEFKDDRLCIRCKEYPQVRIPCLSRPVGIQHLYEGFIGLNVSTVKNLSLQLIVDSDQQVSCLLDISATGLPSDQNPCDLQNHVPLFRRQYSQLSKNG